MLGTIAVLAIVVARSVSSAALEMSTVRSTAMLEADLHAGIKIGVAAILELGNTMRSGDAAADLANRSISVHITNERARIDLNQAPTSVLSALFAAHGASEKDAESLATAIGDWRGGSASQKLAAPQQTERSGAQIPGLTTFDSAN